MADKPPYKEDLLWLVGSSTTATLKFDSAQPATTVARRVPANRGCSFQLFDPTNLPTGANSSITGTLAVSASNAPERNDRLVEPAFWVPLPDLTITLGGQGGDQLPSLQQIFFTASGWVRLAWQPSGSQGQLAGRFDGPRP